MNAIDKAPALEEPSCQSKSRTRESFVSVPCCALRDPNLLATDLRVYAVLLLLGGDSKEVDSGLDEIAERASLSRRGANRAVMRLQRRGYVSTQRRRRECAVISVKPPYDVYGQAVFDPNISVPIKPAAKPTKRQLVKVGR